MLIYIQVNERSLTMTNFQVYKKTLPFSFIQFLVSLGAIVVLVGCPVLGFIIANNASDKGLIGLVIGLILGIILSILINYFIVNRIKAGQIAMMTKGVADDELPDHIVKAGMEEVKGRFAKITAFFVVTNLIKGAFRELGRGINRLGTALGGNTGNAITSAIDSAIQVLLSYLCDCCLGWVMYRKDQGVTRSACEGAVIFFKSGKTLFRNIGRIFGMGILSFLLVGGGLFGIFYLIFSTLPAVFTTLSNEIVEFATRAEITDMPEFIHNPTMLAIVVAAVGAIILWSTIHSVVGRPFILVGVLRNFVEVGKKDIPTDADFADLEKKSPRFAKLINKGI